MNAAAPVYVYGVVRAGALGEVAAEGVAGASVGAVEDGQLAALVSDLPGAQLRVRRADLQRHLAVIEEAFTSTTVLPCRFGTVADSEDGVREFLATRRDELVRGLHELDDRVQLNVRAVYDEERLLRGVLERDPEIARLSAAVREQADYDGQLRLGELVAAAVAEQRELDGARIIAALRDYVDDAVVEEPPANSALKASFLIARKRLEPFDTTLERVAQVEQETLRFDVIGPLPPTAFASAVAEA